LKPFSLFFFDESITKTYMHIKGTLANGMKPSDLKREMNEQFRINHPEIPVEITLSKIRAIKVHLLEIGKALDLEVSSVAHAYVFFEKLIVKVMYAI
jgi:hypothetical protein